MSTLRTPIQVPTELRDQMSRLQSKFRASSHPALITKLIERAEEFDKYREQQAVIFKTNMISLEPGTKQQCSEFKEEMNFNSDDDMLKFLLYHYHNSQGMGMTTFNYYRELQK